MLLIGLVANIMTCLFGIMKDIVFLIQLDAFRTISIFATTFGLN